MRAGAGGPVRAVRADPDTAYFMIHTTVFAMALYTSASGKTDPPDESVYRLVEEVAYVPRRWSWEVERS